MSEAVVDDIVAVLPPLLQSLESLAFIARYLNPPDFDRVMQTAGTPDADLRAVRPRLAQWPADFDHIRTPLEKASDAVLAAFEGLRIVQNGQGDFASLFRALRYGPRAQEALYPLSLRLPPVNQFFVDPALQADAELAARLTTPSNESTGIFHNHNEPGSRGGFSLYVPEYYTPDRAWPLVMALHGGSGNGRAFLWSWLRDARSRGAIVVAPTATGSTWALMGDDTDTPNLMSILEAVRARWNVDPAKMLLTGMSDGGTFLLRDRFGRRVALHPPCAGGGDVPSADGGNGRRRSAPRPARPYHPRQPRLDVPGAGRPANQRGAIGSRRQGDLSGARRSQPYLSARNERRNSAVARGHVGRGTNLRIPRYQRATEGLVMQTFVGMILGALLLGCGVYVYDSMQTSSVANGQVAQANRTIVNWDVAASDWGKLKNRAHEDWVKISSK